jgi:hypothetical protein
MRHASATIATLGLSVAAIAGVTAAAGGSPTKALTSTATPIGAVTATLHTETATVDRPTETILIDHNDRPLYFYEPDTADHVTDQRVQDVLVVTPRPQPARPRQSPRPHPDQRRLPLRTPGGHRNGPDAHI